MLAVLPAHAQTTRKKATRKKAAVTKVVKKKRPIKKKKAPAAEETQTADTGETTPPEPMVFGEPDSNPQPAETPVTPLEKPTPPAVAKPVQPAPLTTPTLATQAPASEVTASGPVALFAVARVPNAENAAVKLEGELLGHLRARGDVTLVDLGAAFPPPAPGSLARADGLFEEGRTAYDNLDPEAAEAKFLAAAEAYTQSPAELNPGRLAQTYVFLGASRHLNGKVDEAKAAFMLAVEADRSTRPDTTLFSQEVSTLFEEARAAVAARPVGTLVVQSQPAGARVTVNGRELGVTPLKGVELPAGHHPVVVSLPGYAPFAAYTQVKSTASAEVKAELEPTPGLAAIRDAAATAATERAFDQDVAPAEARAIGERLGARYVVLAAVWRNKKGHAEAELQAWDLRSKAKLRGVEIELTKDSRHGPAAAADQVRGFVNGAAAPRVAQSGRSGDSLIKRPWFWAVVGGAAAVTAGAIYVATTPDKGRGFNPVSGGVGF
ncbi:PEGA domain-containing protein [Pyxidicoccus fallax]|uniref:PEGA domain-containing protein n=1 Tax=Pyxidicoccus fallax TaxID=394095 RepID=A0A848LK87_9BACT|nr:PEGA domain-containing protein [Pyxidicoccus fallax]NPC85804.1 PEGA domain-containing protein [Pyxidicoccus fallax]